MSRVPDTRKAQPYEVHIEDGPYPFKIVGIKDFTSKNNDTGYPDKFQMSLDAIGDPVEGHCNMVIFPAKSDTSYQLKMICEAVGLSAEGGYDSEDFLDKTFRAEVGHNEWQGKTYANLKAESIAPHESTEDDEPLPF